MLLLRLHDFQANPEDRVFFYSRARAAILLLVLACTSVGLLLFCWRWRPFVGYYVAGVLCISLLLLPGYITARFRPTNWLVRMRPEGLFIKFRSYLNFRLPDVDTAIVFIPYPEIRSARQVCESNTVSDTSGERSVRTRRFVELELDGDLTLLTKALKKELGTPAPREKHWYGTTSTLYRHYPATLTSSQFLRIEWSVVPKAAAFFDAIRPYTTISDPVVISEDFIKLEHLTRTQQEQRLRELDARGETIAAVYLARRLFGCSLSDAKALVEEQRKANL